MGWRPLNRQFIDMTADIAQEFVDMKPMPHERPFSQVRYRKILEKIKRYGHMAYFWQTAIVLELEDEECEFDIIRVDGQHTSRMALNNPHLFLGGSVFVVRLDWECDTVRDRALLYAQINSSESSRTTSDVNYSMAAAIGLQDINGKNLINTAVTAMSMSLWGTHYASKSKEERAALLETNKPFIHFVDEMLGKLKSAERVKLVRSPVFWALYETWLKDEDAAAEFWVLVGTGYGADKHLPQRKLHDYLNNVRIVSGTSTKGSKAQDRDPIVVVYHRCLVGWNAWRAGKTSTTLHIRKNTKPVAR